MPDAHWCMVVPAVCWCPVVPVRDIWCLLMLSHAHYLVVAAAACYCLELCGAWCMLVPSSTHPLPCAHRSVPTANAWYPAVSTSA